MKPEEQISPGSKWRQTRLFGVPRLRGILTNTSRRLKAELQTLTRKQFGNQRRAWQHRRTIHDRRRGESSMSQNRHAIVRALTVLAITFAVFIGVMSLGRAVPAVTAQGRYDSSLYSG